MWGKEGEGSLVSFVVSLNLNRRHLAASQKAAVALEILPMQEPPPIDLVGYPME